jgi:PAS domain S-box-containing protein
VSMLWTPMPDKARVLLVDDNRAFLLAIGEAVRAALPELSVDTLESAEEALERLRSETYDVIVSDVTMPTMDGLTFLDEARALHPDTAFILLTGKEEREIAVEALRKGATDLLQKPVDQITLASSIERALATSRLKRALREHQAQLERKVQSRTRQLAFLSNASKRLAASLDYKTTINEIAKLAVPDIADYCVVHMVDLGGKVERVATKHRDLAKVKLIEQVETKYPTPPDTPAGWPKVLRSGEAELLPIIPQDIYHKVAYNKEHELMLEALGALSMMCVPIKLQGAVIGTITLTSAESGRIFDEEDLALAEELSFRSSIAIENAMLYSQSQNEVRQRARIESELRESEERFRNMADSTPVLVWVTGPKAESVYFNQRWLDFRGTTLAQEIAADWTEAIHPEDRERAFTTCMNAFVSRQLFTMEFRMKRYDGEYRWLLDTGVPRFGKDNEFLGFIGSCIDITDRKQIETELLKAKELAEQANKAKDQFLAVLSHELRTPLTPVLNILQIFQEDNNIPEDLKSFIDIAIHNVNLEARIVNDLLRVTEISAGKLQLNKTPVEMHTLIHKVVPISSKAIKEKHIELTLDLRAKKTFIEGDETRLHQVMANLLENALKFTPEHGKIRIATENIDDRLLVKVIDTGIGIRQELLPVIFNTFEQGESSIHRQFGGLGLGLSISKGLLELHGGTLKADSEGIGKGSTMSFELQTIEAPKSPGQVKLPSLASGQKISILVVEDNHHTLQALKTLLVRRGYHVSTAETLGGAIEQLREFEFDLVISDLGLPDGSGLTIMQHVPQSRTRAIAVSGFCSEEDIRKSKEAGFVEHLAKPFDFKRLQEALDKALLSAA